MVRHRTEGYQLIVQAHWFVLRGYYAHLCFLPNTWELKVVTFTYAIENTSSKCYNTTNTCTTNTCNLKWISNSLTQGYAYFRTWTYVTHFLQTHLTLWLSSPAPWARCPIMMSQSRRVYTKGASPFVCFLDFCPFTSSPSQGCFFLNT